MLPRLTSKCNSTLLLSQPPECGGHRHASPYMAINSVIFMCENFFLLFMDVSSIVGDQRFNLFKIQECLKQMILLSFVRSWGTKKSWGTLCELVHCRAGLFSVLWPVCLEQLLCESQFLRAAGVRQTGLCSFRPHSLGQVQSGTNRKNIISDFLDEIFLERATHSFIKN